MMDYDYMQNMMGGNYWGMMTFGWLLYILLLILIILLIAALIKYLNKK